MKIVNPNNPRALNLTFTVGELITHLGKYDPDLPVIAEWESVGAGFRPENFKVIEYKGREELIIDVGDYG